MLLPSSIVFGRLRAARKPPLSIELLRESLCSQPKQTSGLVAIDGEDLLRHPSRREPVALAPAEQLGADRGQVTAMAAAFTSLPPRRPTISQASVAGLSGVSSRPVSS